MQNHFTFDQLTPLEQCIADFMARDKTHESPRDKRTKKTTSKEPALNS